MYALRERRVHVTQEDFELAVAKVSFVFILREREVHVTQGNFKLAVAKVSFVFVRIHVNCVS